MPQIDVFVTTILSNPGLRGRHERVRRALTSIRLPYAEHDVAGDEQAKLLWKRKNRNNNELPFILVDGEPVGTIEQLDEAVEFGELRQFLRLDAAAPTPSSAITPAGSATTDQPPPSSTSSTQSEQEEEGPLPPLSTITTKTPPPPPKPSLDDFSSLELTQEELSALAFEISQGETFSSGLGSSHDPMRQGYDFSHATTHFKPFSNNTEPLKVERINWTRPLPERPLASEVERDELEGIDQDDLDVDELEQLARELEMEELHRTTRGGTMEIGKSEGEAVPPPLPEKDGLLPLEDDVPPPPTPPKIPQAYEEGDVSTNSLSSPLRLRTEGSEKEDEKENRSNIDEEEATTTSIEGIGSLSKPLEQVERLELTNEEVSKIEEAIEKDLPSDNNTDETKEKKKKTIVVESPVKEQPALPPTFHDEEEEKEEQQRQQEEEDVSKKEENGKNSTKSFLSSVTNAFTIPPLSASSSASPSSSQPSTTTKSTDESKASTSSKLKSTIHEIESLKAELNRGGEGLLNNEEVVEREGEGKSLEVPNSGVIKDMDEVETKKEREEEVVGEKRDSHRGEEGNDDRRRVEEDAVVEGGDKQLKHGDEVERRSSGLEGRIVDAIRDGDI